MRVSFAWRRSSMTNGDKIRSMTNEKLAEELVTFSADCLFCDGCEQEQGFNVCINCIKKWLEEEEG
jgi:hypothetical protein